MGNWRRGGRCLGRKFSPFAKAVLEGHQLLPRTSAIKEEQGCESRPCVLIWVKDLPGILGNYFGTF